MANIFFCIPPCPLNKDTQHFPEDTSQFSQLRLLSHLVPLGDLSVLNWKQDERLLDLGIVIVKAVFLLDTFRKYSEETGFRSVRHIPISKGNVLQKWSICLTKLVFSIIVGNKVLDIIFYLYLSAITCTRRKGCPFVDFESQRCLWRFGIWRENVVRLFQEHDLLQVTTFPTCAYMSKYCNELKVVPSFKSLMSCKLETKLRVGYIVCLFKKKVNSFTGSGFPSYVNG